MNDACQPERKKASDGCTTRTAVFTFFQHLRTAAAAGGKKKILVNKGEVAGLRRDGMA